MKEKPMKNIGLDFDFDSVGLKNGNGTALTELC